MAFPFLREIWINWYENTLRVIRFGLLANLSPETAEKLAHKYAQTWFELK
jgi:hypothetical protein